MEGAPPEPWRRSFSRARAAASASALRDRVERLFEIERQQLAPWGVVAFGAGIGSWFALPGPLAWLGAAVAGLGVAALGAMLGGRAGRALLVGALLFVAGEGLVWQRARSVALHPLAGPAVVAGTGRIVAAEPRIAEGRVRLVIAPDDPGLPARVRITAPAESGRIAGMAEGARIAFRARLQPPPPMALPDTHDFARDLWFKRIGAVGRSLDPPRLVSPASPSPLEGLRQRLSGIVRAHLPERESGIAVALATGDQSGVVEEEADAMRRSGLAHLLSVSGLHIAAVVGAAMMLTLRIGAAIPWLALRTNMVLVAAGAGAVAGVFYTLLTGMQVPTVRSCIAALLVLLALSMGRQAFSIRLVAAGAAAVLVVRPEAIVGPSFQMSFAAVAAIVTLHASNRVGRLLEKREEGLVQRFGRALLGLFLTGLAVEVALIPIALYHFHKSGLYGVIANIVAIPMTTFLTMPLEALALLLEPTGLSGPIWSATGATIAFLLRIADLAGHARGALIVHPAVPTSAFALAIVGGLWLILWRTPALRRWGLLPILAALVIAASARRADLLVTGDGRHAAIVGADGRPALLRERSGDYVRSMFLERSAFDGETEAIAARADANCSPVACIADIRKDGRAWRLLALRSRDFLRWDEMIAACRDADIVIAERRLPAACAPRWLKLDRSALDRSGGVAITLGDRPKVRTVADAVGDHPWRAQGR